MWQRRFNPIRVCSLLAVMVGALWLQACSTQESRVGGVLNLDTDLSLTLEAGNDINPDAQGDTSPVYIRMYELTSAEGFSGSDFIDLYEREESALGDTLVKRRQLPRLAPGDRRDQSYVLEPETRYVGFLAEFYDYERGRYRVIVPVTARNVFRDSIHLQVTRNQISIVN